MQAQQWRWRAKVWPRLLLLLAVLSLSTRAVQARLPESPRLTSIRELVEARRSGDHVSLRGLPLISGADVRILGPASPPLTLAITPHEAAEGAYNLTLDGGKQLFTCIFEAGLAKRHSDLTAGEVLRCRGVPSVNSPEPAFQSRTFSVLLRSGNDVHLLTPAPWWTPTHLLLVLSLLLLLALLGYRLYLRSVQARLTLVIDERARIAREIHDTLAQGFAGIAMQLQAIERSMGQQSAATNAHLAMALHMVRRSRAEAHRSIATLRTLHSYEGLAEMLQKLLQQLTNSANLTLTVVQRGTPVRLKDEVASELLRICQEAVANTVEHAQARSVHATLHYTARLLSLEIQDDGCGFDTEAIGSLDAGHFGMVGMRERAAHIHATFSMHSGPGGTRLRLEVPLALRKAHSQRRFGLRKPTATSSERTWEGGAA